MHLTFFKTPTTWRLLLLVIFGQYFTGHICKRNDKKDPYLQCKKKIEADTHGNCGEIRRDEAASEGTVKDSRCQALYTTTNCMLQLACQLCREEWLYPFASRMVAEIPEYCYRDEPASTWGEDELRRNRDHGGAVLLCLLVTAGLIGIFVYACGLCSCCGKKKSDQRAGGEVEAGTGVAATGVGLKKMKAIKADKGRLIRQVVVESDGENSASSSSTISETIALKRKRHRRPVTY